MRRVSWSLAPIALFALMPAHGGELYCRSHTMTISDARNALRVATRTAGTSKLQKKGMTACMNAGHGRLWINAEAENQPDRSVLHPHVLCNRETGAWSCELSKARTASFEVAFPEGKKPLTFLIPDSIDIARVQGLIEHAFEIAPTLTAKQECGYRPPEKPVPAGDTSDIGSVFRHWQVDGWTEVILNEDGTIEVQYEYRSIRFRSLPSGDEKPAFDCWAEFVVVA